MKRPLSLLAMVLAALITANSAYAIDCSTKVELPARPNISNFTDYNLFVAKIVKYKNTKRKVINLRQHCPDLYSTPAPPPPPQETLGGAIRSAASQPSNAQGAPANSGLSDIGAGQLASTSIITPLVFLRGEKTPQQLPPLPFDVIAALNSGEPGSEELRNYLVRHLPGRDSAAANIFRLASADVRGKMIKKSGNLYFLIDLNGDTIKTTGTIRSESCLSSGCPLDDNGNLILPHIDWN